MSLDWPSRQHMHVVQGKGWKSRKCLEVGYDDDDWIAKSWMARRRASLGRQSSCSRRSADPYLEAAPDPDPVFPPQPKPSGHSHRFSGEIRLPASSIAATCIVHPRFILHTSPSLHLP